MIANVDILVGTRRSLHAVAESVIAGPQHRRHGTIRLVPCAGGFRGVALGVAVEGTELVWAGGRASLDGATCRALGAATGFGAGAPEGLYRDGSGVGLDEVLAVDDEAAGLLATWFAAGDGVLRLLGADGAPVLWPEHFDLAVVLGDAAFGVSPGDGHSAEPYAYVSTESPPAGSLWNAPFGARAGIGRFGGPADLQAFFDQAASELGHQSAR